MPHTNIESLQETFATRGRRDIREAAVWQCLAALDPQGSHLTLAYRQKLERLAEVIAQELHALEETS
jgi:hypothetical protein